MARKVRLVKISDITQFANTLARSIRSNLSWSTKLRGAVKLHPAKESADGATINITIGEGNKSLAGMARAFDTGSGLHGKYKKKYIIQSKSGKLLAFQATNDFSGRLIRVAKVQHPGVEGKGYIKKSIDATRKKATEELALRVRKNLVDELRLTLKEINSQ